MLVTNNHLDAVPPLPSVCSIALPLACSGLVCLELYKAVLPGKPVDAYRNTFANLALPLFAMAEPIPPKIIKHADLSWSLWDRWTLEGDLTVQQVGSGVGGRIWCTAAGSLVRGWRVHSNVCVCWVG